MGVPKNHLSSRGSMSSRCGDRPLTWDGSPDTYMKKQVYMTYDLSRLGMWLRLMDRAAADPPVPVGLSIA